MTTERGRGITPRSQNNQKERNGTMKKDIKAAEKGWVVFSDGGEFAASWNHTEDGRGYRIEYITTCINEAAVISQKAAAVDVSAQCAKMLKNRKWYVGRIERNTKVCAIANVA